MINIELSIWRNHVWMQLMVVSFLPKWMHWDRERWYVEQHLTQNIIVNETVSCLLTLVLCDRAWNVRWKGKCQSGIRVVQNYGSLYVSHLLEIYIENQFWRKKQNQEYNTKEFEACVSHRIVTYFQCSVVFPPFCSSGSSVNSAWLLLLVLVS